MKIVANKLCNFIEKLSLKGQIKTSLLNFTDEGITSSVSAINVAFVKGTLPKEQFDDYEAIGEVGISNNILLTKLLKRYDDKIIKLEKKDNKIVIISETGSTFFVLCSADNVENNTNKAPSIIEDTSIKCFDLDVSRLSSIKEGASVISTKQLKLEVVDNMLSLTAESDVGIKITEELKIEHPDCMCKYGELLMSAIESVSGTVSIYFKTKFPIMLKSGNFVYIIAPIIEEDD